MDGQTPGFCCAVCQETTGCATFSWLEGVCYLKTGGDVATSKRGVVSGRFAPAVPSCSPLQVDTDFIGNDLVNKDAQSPDLCCGFCHATVGCTSFSWFAGVCYLKSGRGDLATKQGVVSGRV
ncbi:Aste57867_11320 [Aphanomyces stellatus]|uniref:Aste57867_11320 protein n=1 Tax=Aphanomyces stellatus TaxID=120398 RepID=A0A485KSL2_9STRA|nr:hypothetical protein As57867_011278 [Aphanomyces stellatus]VFT88182.1 Aste57867_11320 [Aphanomyces stellatus]